jgi:hypothetical protein
MKCNDPNCPYDLCQGHQSVRPIDYTHEHETIKSRLTGKNIEIEQRPMPAAADPSKGGLCPANPFVSAAQSRLMHARPELIGGKAKLKEWEHATDYKHLPEHVKKGK